MQKQKKKQKDKQKQKKKQKPPDLSRLTATMAANQAKVARHVETLGGSIDELVTATLRQDWSEVQRLSGQLAADGRASGFRAVSALAQRVLDEAHRPHNDVGVRRSLIRLIGTYGRTSTSIESPEGTVNAE